MSMTPKQARVRLNEVRRHMELPRVVHDGRAGFDVGASQTAAIMELIQFLEDALA